MTITTDVFKTQEIKKMHNSFERLIKHKQQQKKQAEISLWPKQHAYYCSQIKDKAHRGNPYYKGIEIKKMANITSGNRGNNATK
jgi:hypothetical protein